MKTPPHVARNTPGFTGADLSNLLNEAALLAVREKAQSISRHHLDEAIDRVVAGPKRKGRLGPVRVLAQDKEVFLGRDYLGTRDISQPTMEHLDGEVRRVLDEQKEAAKSILEANRRILDEMAEDLSTRETVQGPELQEALEQVRSPSGNGQVPYGMTDVDVPKPPARRSRRTSS